MKSHKDPRNPKTKSGVPPGTLIHVGDKPQAKVRISTITYDNGYCAENKVESADLLSGYIQEGKTSWVNVDGVHDPEVIAKIGELFNIHSLVLEDIVNTQQRPKIEDYAHFHYLVLNMADLDQETNEIIVEQVSIVLGSDFIISFQEREGDIFDPIRDRLHNGGGRVRELGADYLAYLLMDMVVDKYFLILEQIGFKIDELEKELIEYAEKSTLQKVYEIKRELIFLRKSVWPLREMVGNLQRMEGKLIGKDIAIYLRDLYDHIMRVIDAVETYRDTSSSMIDLYLSSSSIKMNEVMKVLTVISTIFIPLTFITGFYGMNLDFMPEVHSQWTYPAVVGIMVLMVGAQFLWFKRKRWL